MLLIARKRRLYVIGIDSAPLWIIKKLYRKYDMKGFGRFLESGALGEMESTIPPVTAAAWPTIYTGKHPKDHGIMDFLHIDRNYTRQLIYYEPERHRPFWEELASKGKKCLVVTPAMVLQKSRSRNVDMITGWPLQPSYNSRELESAARRFGFTGEPDIGVGLDKGEISLAKAVEMYEKSMRARSELSKHLIRKGNYALAFVCFTETDRIQHYTLNRNDWERYAAPLYKAASDFIEWVIEYSKNDKDSAIMVVSDHGAQPVRDKFLVNSWLIENGYAVLKSDKSASTRKGAVHSAKRYVSERIMKLKIRRAMYNRMPAFMKRSVEKMIDESLEEPQDGEHVKIQEADFDMARTKAFAAVSYGPIGMIWLNDKRFSRPSLNGFAARKAKADIIAKLKKLRTRDGSALVQRIIDGSRYYKNARTFIPPDIIIELATGIITDFSYYSKSGIFMRPEMHRNGDHSRNGIFGVLSKGNGDMTNMQIHKISKFVSEYLD